MERRPRDGVPSLAARPLKRARSRGAAALGLAGAPPVDPSGAATAALSAAVAAAEIPSHACEEGPPPAFQVEGVHLDVGVSEPAVQTTCCGDERDCWCMAA